MQTSSEAHIPPAPQNCPGGHELLDPQAALGSCTAGAHTCPTGHNEHPEHRPPAPQLVNPGQSPSLWHGATHVPVLVPGSALHTAPATHVTLAHPTGVVVPEPSACASVCAWPASVDVLRATPPPHAAK